MQYLVMIKQEITPKDLCDIRSGSTLTVCPKDIVTFSSGNYSKKNNATEIEVEIKYDNKTFKYINLE